MKIFGFVILVLMALGFISNGFLIGSDAMEAHNWVTLGFMSAAYLMMSVSILRD